MVVALVDTVLAKDSPAGMKVLFSAPDTISIFVIKFSASSKSSKSLVISPDDSYWTYNVKRFWSDCSAGNIFTTVALTPEVAPIIFWFNNWSMYDWTVIPRYSELIDLITESTTKYLLGQIKHGAEVIQIFDSWAGLLKEKDLPYYIYDPTLSLVNYTKSLNVPVICFPRGIRNYKDYCEIIKPDTICIDYEVDPVKINKEIKIPVQGGMNPKVLLSDKENLKKETIKYLDIFKDHPYIFNLGHGVLPETDPNMMDYLVKTVKDY